jgi:Asp-tRNA(Asn)/Glu-tRNA(Gln) amidotransferase A subunit family amidase
MRAFITVGTHERGTTVVDRDNRPQLPGVPISVKDLYDTATMPTTAGSRVFEQRRPSRDAAAVKKIDRAGAIVVGKTNLHEFAYGVTNINKHYGTARNPWDSERICGGSVRWGRIRAARYGFRRRCAGSLA